jgi:hypothetical protein
MRRAMAEAEVGDDGYGEDAQQTDGSNGTAQIEELERQYPDSEVAEPFTRGYERGRDQYQQICDKPRDAQLQSGSNGGSWTRAGWISGARCRKKRPGFSDG